MPSVFRPRQLALALDHAESYAREDFLSGPSNENALALIDAWPDWPARAIALVGPEGSGKTHLATIWAAAAGARVVSGATLGEIDRSRRARDRRAGRRGCRRDRRRAGAVPSDQSGPRGGRVSAVHGAHARRRFGRSRCRTPYRGCARLPVGDAASAGRCHAARRHRQARRRPSAATRRKRRRLYLDRISSVLSPRRAPRSSRSTKRLCVRAGRRAGRWRPRCFATRCSATACRPAKRLEFVHFHCHC